MSASDARKAKPALSAHLASALRTLDAQSGGLTALADAIVPSERAADMTDVLAALHGLPPGARMLWAAGASGDYPAYIGAGLLTEQRVVDHLGCQPRRAHPDDPGQRHVEVAVPAEHAQDLELVVGELVVVERAVLDPRVAPVLDDGKRTRASNG